MEPADCGHTMLEVHQYMDVKPHTFFMLIHCQQCGTRVAAKLRERACTFRSFQEALDAEAEAERDK